MMKLAISTAYFAVLGLGLVGCYAPPQTYSNTSSSYYSAPPKNNDPAGVTIKNDPYSPYMEVETGIGRQDGSGAQIYGLYGRIDRKSGAALTFVQWSEVYTAAEWRFYSRASDNTGNRLDFKEVSRDVSSCSGRGGGCVYTETYNVYLTPTSLRQGAKDGASFKIFGKRGDERIVTLPASLVLEFNSKMTEAATLRGKPSAPMAQPKASDNMLVYCNTPDNRPIFTATLRDCRAQGGSQSGIALPPHR